MAVGVFNSNIENLRWQVSGLAHEMAQIEVAVGNRQVVDVENCHAKTHNVYTQVIEDISSLLLKINNEKNHSNEEAMFQAALDVSGIHDKIEKSFNHWNNTLLTFYPTAKINYGRSCLSSPMPNVDTATLNEFPWKREIRGDGNCFFTAFTARYLEHVLQTNDLSSLIDDGINNPTIKQEVLNTLSELQSDPSSKEIIFNDNLKILPLIKYFRLLAADEMRKKPDQFECFLRMICENDSNERSYEDLIAELVLQMGEDAHHPVMTALCQRLKFCVKVIDPKIGAPAGFNVLEGLLCQATFCRNGEHYFVLYSREESIAMKMPAIPVTTLQISPMVFQYKIKEGHTLFVRGGEEAGLNWNKGEPLIPYGDDFWIFQPKTKTGEYKFLINDQFWEDWGGNRFLQKGHTQPPKFKEADLKKLDHFS